MGKIAKTVVYGFKHTGANPTTLSYNAGVVKIYCAINSLGIFIIIEFYFSDVKTLWPTTYNANVVAVNSKVVGFAPVLNSRPLSKIVR
jgi:hypothetical protein